MILRRDERGATAVIVSIMLVVLVGFGALAVDVGALWWDKKQLQNGADAAALALAQSCAEGAAPCGTYPDEPAMRAMAGEYAESNKLDLNVAVTDVLKDGNSVRVDVETIREHWLAPVIGFASSDVPASATASWGGIGAATVLPLTIKMCNGAPVVGQELHIVVRQPGPQSASNDPCSKAKNYEGSPGHYLPGNWGWLEPKGDCEVVTKAGGWVDAHTNPNLPKGCEHRMENLHEQDHVLLPIFDIATGNGGNGRYQLVGYVSLKVTAFCIDHKKNKEPKLFANVGTDTPPCDNNNHKWILGQFVEFVDLGAELGGPDYGSTTVRLTD